MGVTTGQTDQQSKICQISKLLESHQTAKLQLVGEARLHMRVYLYPDRDGVAQMDLGCVTLYASRVMEAQITQE